MKGIKLSAINGVKIAVTLLFLSLTNSLYGQGTTYPYFYRVYFRDKGENILSNYSASDLLSSRAISRRQKAGIPVPDYRDVPVNKSYLSQISLSRT